jgi:hypothetical protein
MRQVPIQRAIAHLRAHAVAYLALFFAITGSATAVTRIHSSSQTESEDRVVATPRTVVREGHQEVVLHANGIKVLGDCRAADSAKVLIGPTKTEGRTLGSAVVFSDSHTQGFVDQRGTHPGTIGIGLRGTGDRGDFNAWTHDTNGSLDGSFFAEHLGDKCVFQVSAIAGRPEDSVVP